MAIAYFSPEVRLSINTMNGHLIETNKTLDPLIQDDFDNKDILGILQTLQGSTSFFRIMIHVIVNAMNKNFQDDFSEIIKNRKNNSAGPAYKTIVFNILMGSLTSLSFVLENLFKSLLIEKNKKIPTGYENLAKKISKTFELNRDQKTTLLIFFAMRNSYHSAFIHKNSTRFTLKFDDYNYDLMPNKKIPTEYTYVSKITLETVKVVKHILEHRFAHT